MYLVVGDAYGVMFHCLFADVCVCVAIVLVCFCIVLCFVMFVARFRFMRCANAIFTIKHEKNAKTRKGWLTQAWRS